MRLPLGSAAISAPAIVIAIWLCTVGQALAGDGGSDAGDVQSFLNGVCGDFGLTQAQCPQLPTVTQGILELAGWLNATPEAVRQGQGYPNNAFVAGNVVAPQSPVAFSNLTPLAFVGSRTAGGTVMPVALSDANATSYFYAVLSNGAVGGYTQPTTLNLGFDYLLRTIPTFVANQTVAKISLPLVVRYATSGSELFVCGSLGCPRSEATLAITAACTGGPTCLAGKITGDFFGTGAQETFNAADLGVTFSASFGPSAISAAPHATFTVQIPLVLTAGNDPLYFNFNNIANTTVWENDDVGSTAAVLGQGASIGTPPYSAPPCANPAGTPCSPPPPAPPPPSTYGICASFANNFTGPVANVAPAVAAFVQIQTDGETFSSAPLPRAGSPLPTCPF